MRKRKTWLEVLAWILCIILFCGLVYLFYLHRQKNIELTEQLQQESDEIKKQEDEKEDALTDIYEKFFSQFEARSIVCWGDSAMVGNGEKSLVDSFQKVVDDKLFVDLKNSFDVVLEKDEYTTPSLSINNMGVNDESMREILVRAGAKTMTVGNWIQIPWDTEPVTVRLVDEDARNSGSDDEELRFASQSDVDFGKVWISDIEGTLNTTDDWFDATHPRYAFVRDEEGNSLGVGAGTEVEIESATKYIGEVPVFFFENETDHSVDDFLEDVKSLVDRYADTEDDEEDEGEGEEIIEDSEEAEDGESIEDSEEVDGEESETAESEEGETAESESSEVVEDADSEEVEGENSGEESSETFYDLPFVVIVTTREGSEVDEAMRDAFGKCYIRNDSFASEMTEETYYDLAQKVYDNLDGQGCFDSVKEKIALVVQEAEEL